jgi:hypothetical protein
MWQMMRAAVFLLAVTVAAAAARAEGFEIPLDPEAERRSLRKECDRGAREEADLAARLARLERAEAGPDDLAIPDAGPESPEALEGAVKEEEARLAKAETALAAGQAPEAKAMPPAGAPAGAVAGPVPPPPTPSSAPDPVPPPPAPAGGAENPVSRPPAAREVPDVDALLGKEWPWTEWIAYAEGRAAESRSDFSGAQTAFRTLSQARRGTPWGLHAEMAASFAAEKQAVERARGGCREFLKTLESNRTGTSKETQSNAGTKDHPSGK